MLSIRFFQGEEIPGRVTGGVSLHDRKASWAALMAFSNLTGVDKGTCAMISRRRGI